MDLNDLSMEFFGARRSEETARTRTTTTVLARAVSDSEGGRVLLEVDGTTTTAEDAEGNQYGSTIVEVPTSPSVREGDVAIVTLSGGKEKSPVVTGVIGSGDRQQQQIDSAYTDDSTYYLLSATVPATPTDDTWEDAGWSTSEPIIGQEETRTLYVSRRVELVDGTVTWSVPAKVVTSASLDVMRNAILSTVSETYTTKTEFAESSDTASGSGRTVEAEDAAGLELIDLTVYGESVQDGTPSPDAPVEIRTVSGVNLLNSDTSAWGVGSLGSGRYNTSQVTQLIPAYGPDGSDYKIKIEPSETYTIRAWIESDTYTQVLCGYHQLESDATFISDSGWQYVQDGKTFTTASNAAYLRVTFRTNPYNYTTTADLLALLQNGKLRIMIQRGSSAPVFMPYSAIGVGVTHNGTETVTPIDLQGHSLASLPDGTKDVLHVEQGRAWIEKNTKSLIITSTSGWYKSSSATNGFYKPIPSLSSELKQGTKNGVMCEIATAVDNVNTYFQTTNATYIDGSFNTNLDASVVGSTLADYKTWLGSNPYEIILALSAPQTIDLGEVSLPIVQDGDTVRIIADVTPEFDASWWRNTAIVNGMEHAQNTADAASSGVTDLREYTDSRLEQTSRDITATFTKSIELVGETTSDITERVSTIENTVRINANGVTIAASDSPISANLNNAGLVFSADNEAVLTLNAQTSTAEAERVSIGNYQWREMGDNAIALVWIGE